MTCPKCNSTKHNEPSRHNVFCECGFQFYRSINEKVIGTSENNVYGYVIEDFVNNRLFFEFMSEINEKTDNHIIFATKNPAVDKVIICYLKRVLQDWKDGKDIKNFESSGTILDAFGKPEIFYEKVNGVETIVSNSALKD